MVENDLIGSLTGAELDLNYSNGIKWLRKRVYDPCSPKKSYQFSDGEITMFDLPSSIFQVNRHFKGGDDEKYIISPNYGLVSFDRKESFVDVQSSILGTLHLKEDDLNFVASTERRMTVYFGTNLLEQESRSDPKVKQAIEERKRAALRIIEVCKR